MDHHGVMARLTAPVCSPGTVASSVQPVLRVGGDFVLRPWRDDDVDAVVEAYGDPDIQMWHRRSLNWAEALSLIGAWRGSWAEETGAYWAVTRVPEGTVLGRVSLRDLDLVTGIAEVGYWTLRRARGLGVAARATDEMCRWAFDDLGLHRLELFHSLRNPGSCRVAEKAGFQLEGTLRSALLHADGWHDMHLHARIANDSMAT